ncbi:uncharacterized protein K460DRAFT_434742 [Cucurbitaria berberidis CBS 394.84]|uniref:MARVEL domain-containing protein n=1 Tax=Cucurbitaria berberidis CBS 394.84 TaxID=1168544 RepID=A0A9P4L4R7_9PLEO|nr:uncharacterized protein K460DRAFT_434742 [Cucurbitaria berberidis CBS 394.84]KAF1841597.1 hypothetical protein K460DRAFT_434742 [Cucurbitaria berberidis CBS 394.84]
MSSKVTVPIALRVFQAFFAIVVLGLAIGLIRGHMEGDLPATLVFIAAVGALSLLAAIIGAAASFVDFLHDQVGVVVDSVVLLLNIAGGILMATKLKGVSCKLKGIDFKHFVHLIENKIICGGIKKSRQCPWSCYYFDKRNFKTIERRCRESVADSTFMFLTAVMLIAGGTLTYMRMKKAH